MVDTLVKSLGSLMRERQTLQRKEQQLVQRQQQLVKGLGRLLQGIGYHLTPIGGGKGRSAQSNGTARVPGRKHLKCPKCDRRFAHPLPMARHVSASHGVKKQVKRAARTGVKKAS
jgi:uncharacterized C2H2 Zn-finger protein